MESTWYLFPGQTLENTKISDRTHALHITKSGWDSITKHLDRKKLIQEAIDKELSVKKYLDDGSKNMTKKWENSLENVRKRKEEERVRMIEEKKEERQRKFFELRKEQEEIRAKYMDKVQKQIFMTTGHARALTSALVTSEILFERQKQQEFMEKIKIHDKEVDLHYLELQKEAVEKDLKEKEEKKKIWLAKELKYGKELKKTIEDKNLLEKSLREEKIKKEAIDNEEAVKEMEKLERMQIEEKIKRKKELYDEKEKFLKKQKEIEQQRIKEEKELDEVVDIYREAKHQIDCLKKQKALELREKEVQRRQKIAAMVMAEEMDKSAAEELTIKKAIAEREAAENAKIKARQEYDAKMRLERLENRDEFIKKEAERKLKEQEWKKWEMLNRYKTDEAMNQYEVSKRIKMWQEILRYRKELCEQMEDCRAEKQREKEIEESMLKSSLQEEDNKFFEYADEVLKLAKSKGRNTFPIERVITQYMKETNVTPSDIQSNNKLEGIKKKMPFKDRKCRCKFSNK